MAKATRALLAGALSLGLLVGCSGSDAPAPLSTGSLACNRDDVPSQFLPLVTGDFTAGNLAELAQDRERRAAVLRDAGFVEGSFSYWKETVDRAPFDPPANALCEVLRFETEAGAVAYVRAIDPLRDGDLPGLTWLQARPQTVVELDDAGPDRSFELRGAGDDGVRLAALYSVQGEHVLSVYVGGIRPKNELEQALAIQARLLQRVSGLLATRGR